MKRPVLSALLEKETDSRKLRLFAVAVARSIQHLMPDPRSIEAIDITEKFADGLVSNHKLYLGYHMAHDACCDVHHNKKLNYLASLAAIYVANTNPKTAAVYTAAAVRDASKRKSVIAHQIAVYHDIFTLIDYIPTNPLIISLAQNIYESNDFTDLPILHDALYEENADNHILNHLKQSTHYKGCFVLDAILQK